ncbi:MAG: ferritin [Kiritimatiellia bacterium]|jgi:ferritin|nr:ferritin [Kiritimatiellia bacterium]MDP6631193.1 ferritin [Kiritimatiellia bacterium]MDP6809785.1 ferritin [Kiritimatiellia bacterium]MDP7025105.1 ferritin [Kiritimatiellia bacterium]
MVTDKMAQALNEQINAELYSAYLYLAMASWAGTQGMRGASSWFFVQAREEMTHVWRFYDYISSQGRQVILDAVEKPPADFETMMKAFEETLAHEQKVTGLINDLVATARTENDNATAIFLQWYVTEQVEEEESVGEIIDQLKLAGDEGGGLLMIDRELGTRVFSMPADLAAGA